MEVPEVAEYSRKELAGQMPLCWKRDTAKPCHGRCMKKMICFPKSRSFVLAKTRIER